MKKLSKILLFSILAVFLVTGSAMALPYLDEIPGVVGPGYDYHIQPVSTSYVYLTDLSYPETAKITLDFEYAGYESDFGIHAYQDITNSLKVFSGSAEPGSPSGDQTQVEFDLIAGTAMILTTTDSGIIPLTIANIGTTFGFYLDANSSGTLYYTDEAYNPSFMEWGLIYNVPGDSVVVAFEDLPLGSWGCNEPDYNDFVSTISDVNPIPEPATMLLLGSGLFGLAVLGRKKFFKKN